jgi:mannose-1-phosphate guanylyltransferase
MFTVEQFVEKPDMATAERYVAQGYLWNSGNFMFRAGVLIEEYRGFESASVEAAATAIQSAGSDLGFVTIDAEAFARVSARSIDYHGEVRRKAK